MNSSKTTSKKAKKMLNPRQCSPCYVSRHIITVDKIIESPNRGKVTFLRSAGCCHARVSSSSVQDSPTLKQQITAKTILHLQSYAPVFLKQNNTMKKYATVEKKESQKNPNVGQLQWQDCPCKRDIQRSMNCREENIRKRRSRSFVNSVSSLRCSSVSSTSSSFPRVENDQFKHEQCRTKRIQAWVEEIL